MFLASKIVSAGIVFIFLTTGISGPRPTPRTSGASLRKEEPAAAHQNDVKQTQQSLSDKGHYRGKVDGVFGLRTGAGIRAFQKAENLPITGQVDVRTADGLGVRPESNWTIPRLSGARLGTLATAGGDLEQAKPSAGIKWAKGRGRARKKLRTEVSRDTAIEDNRRDGANERQGGNERHDQ